MEKIIIGKIVNAVGLKGEVKVYNYSDSLERYLRIEKILVGDKFFPIENVRAQKNMVILKLMGIDDRNGAEAMKGMDVAITEQDLEELPRDTFYIRDLINMDVVDRESGKLLGHIINVLQNTAQDIYEVETSEGKTFMVPAVKEFVKGIDLVDKKVYVSLIEGMLP